LRTAGGPGSGTRHLGLLRVRGGRDLRLLRRRRLRIARARRTGQPRASRPQGRSPRIGGLRVLGLGRGRI
jgi:hypothetical protein